MVIMRTNYNLYEYEDSLHKEGYKYIGGTDEAGRGPLFGPVVAACCILPNDFKLEGLTDSKQLTEKKREKYNPENIFKNKQNNFYTQIPEKQEEKLELIEYKEQRWYQKIFARILKIFNKK